MKTENYQPDLYNVVMERAEQARREASDFAQRCHLDASLEAHLAHTVFQTFLAGAEAVLEWMQKDHERRETLEKS